MIRVEILCDNCRTIGEHTEGPVRAQPHAMRSDLVDLGWHVALSGGRDLCPACTGALLVGVRGPGLKT